MMPATRPVHVTILGLPESVHSTVAGLADVFGIFRMIGHLDVSMPVEPPFEVTIAGLPRRAGCEPTAFRITRTIDRIDHTDVVVVPALMVHSETWTPGAHPEVIDWLKQMHRAGASLCSTCSGALVLAETGLLDGREATTHWAYAETFRRYFPQVRLRLEHLMMTSGERGEIIMSGANGSWHDLALHLISQRVSAAAAQSIARFLLLEWHHDGQIPYMRFLPRRDHGDAVILHAQEWLEAHPATPNPVEEVMRHSGLPTRTFNRRFLKAAGTTAIKYVQLLRIEAAKRRLEADSEPIDEVARQVGYEDPAFFRRLFKRVTGITPGTYRRKLQIPPLHQSRMMGPSAAAPTTRRRA